MIETPHPLLACHGLARCVEPTRWLYRDLSQEFGPGLHVVVGPNGSGKSSLLRDLIGIRQPAQGQVTLRGKAIRSMQARQRAQTIAYLPQAQTLPYDLRVCDLVMLGRAPHRSMFGLARPEDRRAVESAMRSCQVDGLSQRGVLSLSGGERQRVMLARLLATCAPILVLDEPAAALDIGHTLETYTLLRRLGDEGRQVIVAMHELDLARRFADRVLLLGVGKGQVLSGNANEVLSPARVSAVFEVAADLVEGELRFSARTR